MERFDSEEVATMLESVLSLTLDYSFVVDTFPTSNDGVIFKVMHDKKDFGTILGKKGANADALRTIIRAIAGKYNKALELQLVEKYEKRTNLK